MSGKLLQARLLATGFVILLLAALVVGPVEAYEPPAGTVEYAIEHSKYGKIGTHRISFSRSGEDVTVDVVIHVKVKVLFITAHSEESERREVWRGDRLVSYRSRTTENGKLTTVSAREQNGKLAISGSQGQVESDEIVFPSHPWNPAIVNRHLLMDTKTGELLKVSIASAGEDLVEVAGKSVAAEKFVISGDLARDVWFDRQGNWLRLSFVKDGATVTLTRTTPLP